jgi:glyoxylase-like metal-dependent hydrolase (beta-lactamase superfamily II)
VSVQEVRPGLYRIEEPDGGRRLCQYVVEGEERLLVVDAGLPDTPPRELLPLLRSLGPEKRPVVLVLTHPDADHRGGAAVLRSTLPALTTMGHALDREQLADPAVALERRYRAFAASDGVGPGPERLEALRHRLGPPVPIDSTVNGDADLDLGGRLVSIVHVPGHSPGSLAVWVAEEDAALTGDAVMGRGIPLRDGGLLYAPMYSPPAAYLGSIERLERLGPKLVLAGHEPVLEGGDVEGFLADSRAAAARLEALARGALEDEAEHTLGELCGRVADGYATLPASSVEALALTVDGILAELVERGEAAVEPGPPRRFRKVR